MSQPQSPSFSEVYISNFGLILDFTLLVFISLTPSLSVSLPPSLPSFIYLSSSIFALHHVLDLSCYFLLLCFAHFSSSSIHPFTKANCSTFSWMKILLSLLFILHLASFSNTIYHPHFCRPPFLFSSFLSFFSFPILLFFFPFLHPIPSSVSWLFLFAALHYSSTSRISLEKWSLNQRQQSRVNRFSMLFFMLKCSFS